MEAKKRTALGVTQLTANDDSELVLSHVSQTGPFDEEPSGAKLFWRGDGHTRTPKQVFQQGFAPTWTRPPIHADAGKIIWRAEQDDLEHDSAVCIARDIRGAAFFPFTGRGQTERTDTICLYAVAPQTVVNTFRAQQIAEAVETGQMQGKFPPKKGFWRTDKSRWKYDPEEADDDGSSCVWQFQEYASHLVGRDDVVGCWEVVRTMLVEPRVGERQKAGIRFEVNRPLLLNKGHDLLDDAKDMVARYERTYPKVGTHWLSFRGIVECSKTVRDLRDARLFARQIEPIVVDEGSPGARGKF